MQVFISYKSEYRDFARKVHQHIQQWGFQTWFDVENIPKGSYFPDEIDKGLASSDILVGIMTQEAFESRPVKIEWDYFLYLGKPIFPLKYGEVQPPPRYITIQHIDFLKNEAQGFAQLQDALTSITGTPVTPKPIPATKPVLSDLPTSSNAPTDQAERIQKAEPDQPAFPFQPQQQVPVILKQDQSTVLNSSPLNTIWEAVQTVLPATRQDKAQHARVNRARILQKVHDYWVVGVLENALKESGAFNLQMSAAPSAVLRHKDYGDYTLPADTSISDVYNDLNRELLILGAPGAGKTILLLQLTQQLILRAQADPELPIPVLFNLSSWAAERKLLSDWLVDEFHLKYEVPRKLALVWVKAEQVTLLLDGLDEVAEQYRNDCVEAINVFRNTHLKTDVAVCSRIADYELLTSKLDLRGAITLQPLTPEQINTYLDRPELITLRQTMQTDGNLKEMASTPFLLNTMVAAYQNITPDGLMIHTSIDPVATRRRHLFDAYAKRMIKRKGQNWLYSSESTIHWLSELARMMTQQNKSILHMGRIQPDWLQPSGLRWLCSFLSILVTGVAIGVVSGVGVGVYMGEVAGLTAGLILGISAAISILFAIVTHMRMRLTLVAGVRAAAIMALGFVLQLPIWIYVLLFVLLLVFYKMAGLPRFKDEGEIETVDKIGFVLVQALVSSIPGIIVGFALGGGNALLVIPAFMLLGGMIGTRSEIPMGNSPNQEIKQSLQSANQIGLMIGVVLGLALGAVAGLQYVPLWIPVAALVVWFHYGGLAVVQHTILRLILWAVDKAPLNYSRFLDDCASINLLRKVGGGYIFVHRYLLEYFASLETS